MGIEIMTPLSLEELAELSRSAGIPVRKMFHCHPAASRALKDISEPATPMLGVIGDVFGIDVFEHPDMEFGAWEIRAGDEVVDSGTIRFQVEFGSEYGGIRPRPGNWLA